uniref:Uncharacterized protein n=1 Tax=viral metagenome TaxID=1070528 RepID=A0A6M3LB69_9ZZZZ
MERDEIDRIIRMTKTMFERWEQRIEALFADNDMRLCRPSEKPKEEELRIIGLTPLGWKRAKTDLKHLFIFLQDWPGKESVPEKPKERICTECAHMVRVNATDGRYTKCNRHRNIVTGENIPCEDARGQNLSPILRKIIADFGKDDCGSEGKFWTPEKQKPLASASVGFAGGGSSGARGVAMSGGGSGVNPQFHERTKHEPVDFKTSWAVKEGAG